MCFFGHLYIFFGNVNSDLLPIKTFKKNFIYLDSYFRLHLVFVAACRLSLVAPSRGYSVVAVLGLITEASLVEYGLQNAWGSVAVVHGLGNCDLQALNAGSVVVAHRLCCSMACEIFPGQGSDWCPLHCKSDS